MHYEINISKNGVHHFATAERSISTKTKLREVYDELKQIYTEEKGFKLSVSMIMTIGENVDMTPPDSTTEPQYGVIVTWEENNLEKWDLVNPGPISWKEAINIKYGVLKTHRSHSLDIQNEIVRNKEKPVIVHYKTLQEMLDVDKNK